MGKILVIKNADFSYVAVDKVDIVNREYGNYIPEEQLTGNDYANKATEGMSFNFVEQVFDGSCGYKKVEITFKGKTDALNSNVYLIEVPTPDTEITIQHGTNVGQLGTIDILSNEYVRKEFDLPNLESDKKYIVAIESINTNYYLTDASLYDADAGIHPYTLGAVATNPYIERYYDAYHGRGSYIYSYFQMRFK